MVAHATCPVTVAVPPRSLEASAGPSAASAFASAFVPVLAYVFDFVTVRYRAYAFSAVSLQMGERRERAMNAENTFTMMGITTQWDDDAIIISEDGYSRKAVLDDNGGMMAS